MVGSVGYSYYNPYASLYGTRGVNGVEANGAVKKADAAALSVRTMPIPAAQTGTPVQPVQAVGRVSPTMEDTPLNKADLMLRWETDPAAIYMRGRIQYGDQQPTQPQPLADFGQALPFTGREGSDGHNVNGTNGASDAVLNGAKGLNGTGDANAVEGADDAKSPQEVMEESECQTCKERKYQDGSDDPGVSFKSPTHISPEMAASEVRGHEMEHVVRNRAEAVREDRKVVSQSVTYHTAICPECGRVYVSGGTTRTTTAAEQEASGPYGEEEDNEGSTSASMGAFVDA